MTLNLYKAVYFYAGREPSRPIRWIWATDLASAAAEFLNHHGSTMAGDQPPRVLVAQDGTILVEGGDVQYRVSLAGKVADL